MFRECRQSKSDPVLYLGVFLIHNCDHFTQAFVFSFGKKYFDTHSVDLDFFHFFVFLVGQIFRFVWVSFEPLRFCIF